MRVGPLVASTSLCVALLAACTPSSTSPSPSTPPANGASPAVPASVAPINTGPSPSPASARSPSSAASPIGVPSPSVAALPSIVASPSTSGGALADFPVGYSEIYVGNVPLWYGVEKGIFARHGLNVTLQYTASNAAISALLSNGVVVTNGGGSEALSANASGSDLVVIATTVPKYPYLFLATSDVQSLGDLRGKTVGVSSPGSSSDIATRVGLTQEGLNPNTDVSIVAVGSQANRSAALLSGAIQGGLDQPPSSVAEVRQGLHVLFDMTTFNLPTTNNSLVVTRAYLNAHRDLVQAYVDGFMDSLKQEQSDQQGLDDVIAKYLSDSDPNDQAQTIQFANEIFANPPMPAPEQFQDAVSQLSPTDASVSDVDLNHMIDASLVQSAAARGVGQ